MSYFSLDSVLPQLVITLVAVVYISFNFHFCRAETKNLVKAQ